MSKTFFFYDLETSGLNPREDRIMQFAGQRTDLDLNPIGDPINLLVRLNDDVLPSPEAILVTGITPQKTVEEGYLEAEFAKILTEQVFTPNTITVGFNNVRFDDEFIRYLFWRNFYDPYEWSYKDGRSRWDILDVVRLTRALRPKGINWPVNEKGKAVNKLEPLAAANNIIHTKAHDAMSDVEALIGITKLIRSNQPQLFDYLLKLRDKEQVKKLINLDEKRPFVYSSGRYSDAYNKTTVAFPLTSGANGNVLVYDLRHDPSLFVDMDQAAIAATMFADPAERKKKDFVSLPIKQLQYNRCPAVAPVSVLDSGDGWKAIGLDAETVKKHQEILVANPAFAENVRTVYEARPDFESPLDAEGQLYDGFLNDADRLRVEKVRSCNQDELADFTPDFIDDRLPPLFLRYKARNFPGALAEDEAIVWEAWRSAKINAELPNYLGALQTLSASTTSESKLFMLQELQFWAESIAPLDSV